MKILLMEDDPVLGDIISGYLSQYYEITHVFDSVAAQTCIDKNHYDLFIFDINVPGKSGVELLAGLRFFNNSTPAIIITAYTDLKHLRGSFDAGAYDYIRKPFELEELRLRVEKSKILFHIDQNAPLRLSVDLVYYPSKHMISNNGENKTLSPKEVEILDYFIAHPKRLISQEELMQNVWEFDKLPSDATLRSYIRKLREIIGSDKIVTQRGMGYRYE